MAAKGSSPVENDNSLERIKKQLASGSGRNLLQGPLLKRSETLRKWNERWVILDPTTGKMEYKTRRNETAAKGAIIFDAASTITISPVNFHGLPKYDGCCFYIGTPQKKDYFLCAETPGAARAWVSTLHAAQLVLRAHREAVNSLSGNGSAKLGTIATVVAAANSTAAEASKEIEAAMKISMKTALSMLTNTKNDGHMDDLSIMKETLCVKDEELQHLAREIRARDATIREIAEKLTDTAEAAEVAASAARMMDEERSAACAEVEHLKREAEQQLESSLSKLQAFGERTDCLSKERDQLLKQRDSALHEAQLWRSELAKAREHVVILEAAVVRADERVRVAEADAEAKIKDALEKEMAAIKDKEGLLAYMKLLQSQIQRQPSNVTRVFEEKAESCSNNDTIPPLTKHVDSLEGNVYKACLSVSRSIPVAVEEVEFRAVGESEWAAFQAGGARIADVREISPEAEGNSMDILVISPAVNGNDLSGGSQP